MFIQFQIEYRTVWGEEVKICGSVPELGDSQESDALTLQTDDGIHWHTAVDIVCPAEVNYHYSVFRNGQLLRSECPLPPRSLNLSTGAVKKYRIYDTWRDIPAESYYFSSAFSQVFRKRPVAAGGEKEKSRSLQIRVYCPDVAMGQVVAISGNHETMGDWDPAKVLLPDVINFPEFGFSIPSSASAHTPEYKFVLYNPAERKIEQWEKGSNRRLADFEISPGERIVISDCFVQFDTPGWRGAGVAIPVFSLKSEKSFGVGDFGDLKKMIDWASVTGQQVVQILPVNDTTLTHTWKDSYPYKSISIYALHPMYLNVHRLGEIPEDDKRNHFEQERQRLNALPTVDYEQVNRLKWEYIRLLFAREGSRVLACTEFLRFFEENKAWLVPYAVYSYLRDAYRTPDFRQWPRYSVYDATEIEHFAVPASNDYPGIAVYYYVQYHLHCQLLEASTYAREKGVVLKGDIPIGISRSGADAWTEPSYFRFDGQAGAPPDDFSVDGQNWGFPTYNWPEMEKDGYSWWVRRFRKMSGYFDAYRIDHILGFFRIWEIPVHAVSGLLGQFSPALPMDKAEIESYGIPFDEPLFLEPSIHARFLPELFGPDAEFVKQTFIRPGREDGMYEMRPEFDTQRKVEAYFADPAVVCSHSLTQGLYRLIADVLFLRDREIPDKYHPRICARSTYVYQTLSQTEKAAFDRLYDHYFYHRHDRFWYEQAMKKLPVMIASNRMLVCGEDLGMIPACVESVMDELRIMSLEIERMPKTLGEEFGQPAGYPYRSVTTFSTHDMSNLRAWWKEDPGKTGRYYNQVLGFAGLPPQEAGAEICRTIVRRNLESNSMLAILSFQDWLSIDQAWRNPNAASERINLPSNPQHYWRYRMHVTLEELLQADALNDSIRRLIDQTKRISQT